MITIVNHLGFFAYKCLPTTSLFMLLVGTTMLHNFLLVILNRVQAKLLAKGLCLVLDYFVAILEHLVVCELGLKVLAFLLGFLSGCTLNLDLNLSMPPSFVFD